MRIPLFITAFFYLINSSYTQLKNTYIIDIEGNKTLLYENINKKSYNKNDYAFSSDYAITAQFFYYHDENGELIKHPQAKLDSLIVEDHIFITKGIKGNGGPKRLHEVLVKSNEYIITQYYSGSFRVLYIYDHDDKCVLNKTVVSRKLKDDTKTYDEEIQPRFKDCPDLLNAIEQNFFKNNYYNDKGWGQNNKDNMFRGIYNYTCE